MEELKSRFPEGVEYDIAYDTTPFIRESVDDVIHTLMEAVVLVALVVLAFLQNWRAPPDPADRRARRHRRHLRVAMAAVLHFSLNNISLFGLVLAIGIVVDDAIVVVENVERWLDHGLPPREAARRAMDEVTGPVIAIALVLCAVFVPCAFIGGITGRFFRQFAVTIAASTAISAFNSLTLSPSRWPPFCCVRGTARKDPLTRTARFRASAGSVPACSTRGSTLPNVRLRLDGALAAAPQHTRHRCLWRATRCWSSSPTWSVRRRPHRLCPGPRPGPADRQRPAAPTRRPLQATRRPWPVSKRSPRIRRASCTRSRSPACRYRSRPTPPTSARCSSSSSRSTSGASADRSCGRDHGANLRREYAPRDQRLDR